MLEVIHLCYSHMWTQLSCVYPHPPKQYAQYIGLITICNFRPCLLHLSSWMQIFPSAFGSQTPSTDVQQEHIPEAQNSLITWHPRYSDTLRAGRSGVRAPVWEQPAGVKRPGRGFDHPIPSSAEVKERVEVHPRACMACYRVKFIPRPPFTFTWNPECFRSWSQTPLHTSTTRFYADPF